jgi:hypothetical protein
MMPAKTSGGGRVLFLSSPLLLVAGQSRRGRVLAILGLRMGICTDHTVLPSIALFFSYYTDSPFTWYAHELLKKASSGPSSATAPAAAGDSFFLYKLER